MKTGVLLALCLFACGATSSEPRLRLHADDQLPLDDLQVAPATLAADLAEARKLGFLRDAYSEYDLSCPPKANYHRFVKGLPLKSLQAKKLSRSALQELVDRGDWNAVDKLIKSERVLISYFKGVSSLRRGYRLNNEDAALSFPVTANAAFALKLLLTSAEREAVKGNHSAALEQLRQAITFTNLMASQPAYLDVVLGRTEQARVLISINRIASRLRKAPEKIAPYEKLVLEWDPKFNYLRTIRFETNKILQVLVSEKDSGMYTAAKTFWRMDREAEDEQGNPAKPLTQEEKDFLATLDAQEKLEKPLLPYSLDRVSAKTPALAVVVSEIFKSAKASVAKARALVETGRFEFVPPENHPPKLSSTILTLLGSFDFDRSEDMFYTHRTLTLTAMRLYKSYPTKGFPKDLSAFVKPPVDLYGRPIEIYKGEKGLSIRSLGRDGKPDPAGRRADDRFLPLEIPLPKRPS